MTLTTKGGGSHDPPLQKSVLLLVLLYINYRIQAYVAETGTALYKCVCFTQLVSKTKVINEKQRSTRRLQEKNSTNDVLFTVIADNCFYSMLGAHWALALSTNLVFHFVSQIFFAFVPHAVALLNAH